MNATHSCALLREFPGALSSTAAPQVSYKSGAFRSHPEHEKANPVLPYAASCAFE